jgi:hypothetical protein
MHPELTGMVAGTIAEIRATTVGPAATDSLRATSTTVAP